MPSVMIYRHILFPRHALYMQVCFLGTSMHFSFFFLYLEIFHENEIFYFPFVFRSFSLFVNKIDFTFVFLYIKLREINISFLSVGRGLSFVCEDSFIIKKLMTSLFENHVKESCVSLMLFIVGELFLLLSCTR